jgi:hypothetical protein
VGVFLKLKKEDVDMKIQADENNGIFLVDQFDENFDELTGENILMECLADASCLPVYAEVTSETLKKIEVTYSVKDIRVSQG